MGPLRGSDSVEILRPRTPSHCTSHITHNLSPHTHRRPLFSLSASTQHPPARLQPPSSFSFSFRTWCLQCGKAGIISTAFHYYDNTLWGLKAIETLRETGNFIPPGKFIYFLSPCVISWGGEREVGGGVGWKPADRVSLFWEKFGDVVIVSTTNKHCG